MFSTFRSRVTTAWTFLAAATFSVTLGCDDRMLTNIVSDANASDGSHPEADGSDPNGGNDSNCNPNPCENGGTCASGAQEATCACKQGYSGATCGIIGVSQISAGQFHTCVVLASGSVQCWGYNEYGQLGLGDKANRGDQPGEMGSNLPTVNLGSGRTAKTISAGSGHTCAILDNNALKCWGAGGLIGLDDRKSYGDGPDEMGDELPVVNLGSGRTVKAIALGEVHSCAILDNNTVKCWGGNDWGQLGVQGDHYLPSHMGDALPIVKLGSGRTAKAIAVGNIHSCAILDNNAIKCWGSNYHGQLGASDLNDLSGTVDLGSGRTAKAITAGATYTCALLDNNSVKCWGGNFDGGLGLGDTKPRYNSPSTLPAVSLGSGRSVKAITAGLGQTCAILDNSALKCWGLNGHGELGLGDKRNRGDDASEMGDKLPAVDLGSGRTAKAITASMGAIVLLDFGPPQKTVLLSHTCALLDDNSVKCWGSNGSGKLGLGSSEALGDNPGEMGDKLPTVVLR